MDPRELYASGELSACASALEQPSSFDDGILRCQALKHLFRYDEAIATLKQLCVANPQQRALARALEAQCHAYQGSIDVARHSLSQVQPASYPLSTQFEMAYARMLIAWVLEDPSAMALAIESPRFGEAADLRARWLYARSWVAAAEGQYREQLELLEQAVRDLADGPELTDLALLTHATRSLAHLVREISAPHAFDLLIKVAESITWTRDLQGNHFLTLRGLAWACALRGSHAKALRFAYAARDLVSSPMWVAACYADQAYLARMAAENASADALLFHAVKVAEETAWDSSGEERVALLNLIELVADRDLGAAYRLLRIYDGISAGFSPRLAYAHDRRFHAMEEYARGHVSSASGHHTTAIAQLRSAFSTFRSVDYAWRAAASALRLHVVTNDDRWLARAGDSVAEFTESSVAMDIRQRAAGVADPRVASLTSAQRRVYELLCEGLDDKAIADRLNISPYTVKNHGMRVRAAFGVRSRSALMAARPKLAV